MKIRPSAFILATCCVAAMTMAGRNLAAAEPSANPRDTVYLFTSFRGNGENGLHLAYSTDALRWTDLGRSFLAPKVGVSKLMRDPCIARGPDGTFHMVWTPGWDESGIGYASSKDLLNWSEQKYLNVMAHEPETQNAWAPELLYDEKGKQFLIYWASTIRGRFPGDDGHPRKSNHRMYCTTTRDFVTFTPTKLLFDPGYSVIDSIILPRPEGGYAMVLKDERREILKLRMAWSDNLLGPYTDISDTFTEERCEGPSAIRIGDEWFLYFDLYTRGAYGGMKTRDFKTWTNITKELSFPRGHRHGSVLEIPANLLEPLKGK